MIIQSGIYPKYDLCSQEDLYFRFNEKCRLDSSYERIVLERKGKIWTDTYFNSLSVGKWKRHTTLKQLTFALIFRGRIKIKWQLHRAHHQFRVLAEHILEQQTLSDVHIPLEFWQWCDVEDGMLFFEIEALTSSTISHFYYETSDAVAQSVKLGIVITHYNRAQFVLPAIERIKTQLLQLSEFRDKVSLFVIDNSQNLPECADLAHESIHIIKNRNLGGSGGFMRGLLAVKDREYTHCLFMDDDASCEVESIRRSIALLSFFKDPKTAIAGALLRSVEKFRQFENGARFDGICHQIKGGGIYVISQLFCLTNWKKRSITVHGGFLPFLSAI